MECLINVQCEHHWLHDTHRQADSPIIAKRVPALHCQWLQQLQLFVPLAHPDLTPWDFSTSHSTRYLFVGICEKIGLCSPILRDVDELKARLTEAVATIDNAMLGRVWQKLDYRLDVCRVTNGAHIEHLRTFQVKIEITSFLNSPDAFLYP